MCRGDGRTTAASGATTLKQLFDSEPDRLSRYTVRQSPGSISTGRRRTSTRRFSSNSSSARSGWASPRRATRCSPAKSSTRARAGPPTHVAERGSGAPDEVDLATARRQRMRALVDAIEAGAFGTSPASCTSASAGRCSGPRCWSMRLAAGRRPDGALPLQHRRRRVRRRGQAARPGDDAGRCRVQDLLDPGNPGQPATRRARGLRRPESRIPTAE